jgi:hypothetical protein
MVNLSDERNDARSPLETPTKISIIFESKPYPKFKDNAIAIPMKLNKRGAAPTYLNLSGGISRGSR